MRTFFRLLAFAFATLPTSLPAAEFSRANGGDLRCSLSLSGPIEPGDADDLKTFLAQNGIQEWDLYRKDRICLDSPGGSFSEGVKLAKLFNLRGIGTGVEAGKRCESACALAFMGGTSV